MTIAAEDLIAPLGEIEPALFPADDEASLLLRLQAYVDDGTARTAAITDADLSDRAVEAWAYYRAYDAIYLVMSRAHATKSIAGEASASRLASQIEAFKQKRDNALAAYDTILAEAGVVIDVAPTQVGRTGPQFIKTVF